MNTDIDEQVIENVEMILNESEWETEDNWDVCQSTIYISFENEDKKIHKKLCKEQNKTSEQYNDELIKIIINLFHQKLHDINDGYQYDVEFDTFIDKNTLRLLGDDDNYQQFEFVIKRKSD